MSHKIKVNYTNPNLWCNYSKEKIHIGEEYFTVIEIYYGENIVKHYKAEYLEFIEEEEGECI